MAVDVREILKNPGALADTSVTKKARGMKGSAILKIAGHVRQLVAEGKEIQNFTIGDFRSSLFPIPEGFQKRVTAALEDGQTHYPPATGIIELQDAVREFYKRELGLDYPDGCVQVGAGARPPIYAAFESILEAGDTLLYPVPTWNVGYYAYLNDAIAVPVVTKAENGFMPTPEDLAPHLQSARVLLLNSPLNPAGTLISRELLLGICEQIIAENKRREQVGERPLILIYDQVYWQLTFGEAVHYTPVGLVPEMAKYTILIDAISKCWAATGMRVGWAVVPPWIRDRMKPLMGHMGAWAARPEQLATAQFMLSDEGAVAGTAMVAMRKRVSERLDVLRDGLIALKDEGLAVDCFAPEGAIYLSAWFGLHGAKESLTNDEAVRAFLLEEAGVAVVPFTAFGYPDGTGWVRFSVGSVSVADVHRAVEKLGVVLRSLGSPSE